MDLLKIDKAGCGNGLGGTEMLEERPFPRGTHAANLIQRIGTKCLGAAFSMTADGESVRLISQALQEI